VENTQGVHANCRIANDLADRLLTHAHFPDATVEARSELGWILTRHASIALRAHHRDGFFRFDQRGAQPGPISWSKPVIMQTSVRARFLAEPRLWARIWTFIAAATGLVAAATGEASAAFYPREGTEIIDSKLNGPGVRSGRMSWFGQYGYGRHSDGMHRHVWRDSGDNGINASGLPQTVPGIALMDRRTLGHWFEVELNGRVFLVRQVDVGPHPRTGRLIDINAPLCDMAGFTPHNFPTDRVAKWRYIGSPQQMVAMRQKPKLKQLALLDTWDMGMSDQPRLAFDLVTPKIEADPPNLSRAAAKSAPWLAAAPKTVDILTSPRHFASVDKKAIQALGAMPMGVGGPMPALESEPMASADAEPHLQSASFAPLPAEAREPDSAARPVPAVASPAPRARPAATRSASRVSKRYQPEASFEDQILKPLVRLFGGTW
jgi:hypothetical protein